MSNLNVVSDSSISDWPHWKLQDAKNRFSEMVDAALANGPQIVTRRGVPVVMVISYLEYLKARSKPKSFLEMAKQFRGLGDDLDISRNPSPSRDIDLE